MRELIDTIDAELDSVCGGHHHHHHEHYGQQGQQGQLGDIVNFGNIVIEQNIALQVGVAVGSNASVTNVIGSQTNSISIASVEQTLLAELTALLGAPGALGAPPPAPLASPRRGGF